MKKKLLIIGFGSSGRKFANIAKKKFKKLEVFILTRQKKIGFNTINEISDIKSINPQFIIICSPTALHFDQLKKINSLFKNKRILIEKPLFDKFKKIKNNNKVFVGYNLRILKIVKFVKSFIRKNKNNIYDIYFINHSYLPHWRKNINYQNSSSAKRKFGGGVILDCSHEIDLVRWMMGEVKILKVFKSKNSKLKIETEDNCKVFAKNKKSNIIIDLNYYSLSKKRKILISGHNFNLRADLVNSEVIIVKKNKKIIKKFNKKEIQESYFKELEGLIINKNQNLTNYHSAILTQKLINKIQDF
tara:strand:- start:2252 stop:3157 length:906 start_codon:yes stop_codon:yes gene_type:complete